MIIRDERRRDYDAIRAIITSAFEDAPRSSGREAEIVEALQAANALTISLVAEMHGNLVGHVAFSPISIDGRFAGWHGLGPVAVLPRVQRCGIGSGLIRAGLERIQDDAAHGCVVLGNPAYYRRFGFEPDGKLRFPPAPAEYFQQRCFIKPMPAGVVAYHQAFNSRN